MENRFEGCRSVEIIDDEAYFAPEDFEFGPVFPHWHDAKRETITLLKKEPLLSRDIQRAIAQSRERGFRKGRNWGFVSGALVAVTLAAVSCAVNGNTSGSKKAQSLEKLETVLIEDTI